MATPVQRHFVVSTRTGDKRGAGTDAHVSLALRGASGAWAGPVALGPTSVAPGRRNSDLFERSQTDSFAVALDDVGDPVELRISHDNTGLGPGWFLEESTSSKLSLDTSKRAPQSPRSSAASASPRRAADSPRAAPAKPLSPRRPAPQSPRAAAAAKPASPRPAAAAAAREPTTCKYAVSVTTGDARGAGTDARVFVTLFGTAGSSGKRALAGGKELFERGRTDRFEVECPRLGELMSLFVEHDNSGLGPGWFLERVVVAEPAPQSRAWEFPCHRWLARDEDDGLIIRELRPLALPAPSAASAAAATAAAAAAAPDDIGSLDLDLADGQGQGLVAYTVTTVTGDRSGAGTDANVFVNLVGSAGESGKRDLRGPGNLFERNKSDTFELQCPDLGDLQRLVIGHDNKGIGPGWFLDRVVVRCAARASEWTFHCGRWLSDSEDDRAIVRSLEPFRGAAASAGAASASAGAAKGKKTYRVTTVTGDFSGAGTDAAVHVTLKGTASWSPSTLLRGRGNLFERGQRDTFEVECEDLGELKSAVVGHDNSGLGPGWFLDRLLVEDAESGVAWELPCGKWLAKDQGDGLIERELAVGASPAALVPQDGVRPAQRGYVVSTFTGDVPGAGTDANVSVVLFGEQQRESGRLALTKRGRNLFERGQRDDFEVACADLGELERVLVSHDNKGLGAAWFLDRVVVREAAGAREWEFPCGKWLAVDKDDCQIARELRVRGAEQPAAPAGGRRYVVETVTGDRLGAGTDANVHVTLFGTRGDSGRRQLSGRALRNAFERGARDAFDVVCDGDLGDLTRVVVGHDNSGAGAAWFLEEVRVTDAETGREWVFPCARWLARSEDDGRTERELAARGSSVAMVDYTVTVRTGSLAAAGTSARVFVWLHGDGGSSGQRELKGYFARGSEDVAALACADLGGLTSVTVAHDNSGLSPGWFLDSVAVRCEQTAREWFFPCERWLAVDEDDHLIKRELPLAERAAAAGQAPPPDGQKRYRVSVTTGDRAGAGTDANVFVSLHGALGESGERQLTAGGGNLFERGRTDAFTLDSPDLGELQRVVIRHDNSGLGASWFLSRVVVRELASGAEWAFPCEQWLSSAEGDRQLLRELFAEGSAASHVPRKTYTVATHTGNVRGAGTDANVFVVLTGALGSSGRRPLAARGKNLFERSSVDEFAVQCADLGELRSLTVGHDNSGASAGWFLDKVVVSDAEAAREWVFRCGRWLAVDEDDRQIVRELRAEEPEQLVDPKHYKLAVTTGDRHGAGTDAKVFVQLRGLLRSSGRVVLEEAGGQQQRRAAALFERAQTDEFELVLSDLGDLKELVVGHDNTGSAPGWFLERVEVRQLESGAAWAFACGRWLAADEDDRQITRVLTPDAPQAQAVRYRLSTHTGSCRGAGTDAAVFVNLVGDLGESGEKKLVGQGDLFEKGRVDTFELQLRDLGELRRLVVWHDNTGQGPGWFLDKVVVHCDAAGKAWEFPCGQWLAKDEADGQICRELLPVGSALALRSYEVSVVTGDRPGAGTNANVFVVLVGAAGSSARVALRSACCRSGNRDLFERRQTDVFEVSCVDVGALQRLVVGHDNSGSAPAWFLDRVRVVPSGSEPVDFPCAQWLSLDEGDHQIVRELRPASELRRYRVTTVTGQRPGSGTDARVFATLEGTAGSSGVQQLKGAGNCFERGRADTFAIECDALGDILRCVLWHDNSGPSPGWFVDSVVVVDEATGDAWQFDCGRWLSSTEDDRAISRTLVPTSTPHSHTVDARAIFEIAPGVENLTPRLSCPAPPQLAYYEPVVADPAEDRRKRREAAAARRRREQEELRINAARAQQQQQAAPATASPPSARSTRSCGSFQDWLRMKEMQKRERERRERLEKQFDAERRRLESMLDESRRRENALREGQWDPMRVVRVESQGSARAERGAQPMTTLAEAWKTRADVPPPQPRPPVPQRGPKPKASSRPGSAPTAAASRGGSSASSSNTTPRRKLRVGGAPAPESARASPGRDGAATEAKGGAGSPIRKSSTASTSLSLWSVGTSK
eukprot:m51a1_g6220 hypothetical protein (2032) ;mRNA; r:217273-223689